MADKRRHKQTNLMLDVALMQQIRLLAAKEGKSLNVVVNQALADYLQQH